MQTVRCRAVPSCVLVSVRGSRWRRMAAHTSFPPPPEQRSTIPTELRRLVDQASADWDEFAGSTSPVSSAFALASFANAFFHLRSFVAECVDMEAGSPPAADVVSDASGEVDGASPTVNSQKGSNVRGPVVLASKRRRTEPPLGVEAAADGDEPPLGVETANVAADPLGVEVVDPSEVPLGGEQVPVDSVALGVDHLDGDVEPLVVAEATPVLTSEAPREGVPTITLRWKSAFEELARIAELRHGWVDGTNGLPVDQATMSATRNLLEELAVRELPTPEIEATVFGGVSARWTAGSAEVVVELRPWGSMCTVYTDPQIKLEKVFDTPFGDHQQVIEAVSRIAVSF